MVVFFQITNVQSGGSYQDFGTKLKSESASRGLPGFDNLATLDLPGLRAL